MPTRAHGLRQLVEREARAQGAEVEVEIELDSLNHIRTLVSAGHGYSVLSHSAVQEELAAGRLSAAPLGRLPSAAPSISCEIRARGNPCLGAGGGFARVAAPGDGRRRHLARRVGG